MDIRLSSCSNRTILSYCILLLFSLHTLTACTHKSDQAQVNHIVLLWLKPGVSPQKAEQIIRITRQLANINGVEQLRVGRSIPSDRNIVDDSFDIGIYMRFNSKQAMDKYLKDPQHVALVSDHIKPNITKIVVYDF